MGRPSTLAIAEPSLQDTSAPTTDVGTSLAFAELSELVPGADENLGVCVYCKRPGSAAHTGQSGNRYFTCSECTTSHLTSIEAEKLIAAWRTHRCDDDSPALRAFHNTVESILAVSDDPSGVFAAIVKLLQQEKNRTRTWTISTKTGVTVSGYLPDWANNDPSEGDIDHDRLELRLADLSHGRFFDGVTMRVAVPGYANGDGNWTVGPEELFRGGIVCRPYSNDPTRRVPFAVIQVVEDFDMEGLGPEDVSDVAMKLRAQADRLDLVTEQLAAARADWAANAASKECQAPE